MVIVIFFCIPWGGKADQYVIAATQTERFEQEVVAQDVTTLLAVLKSTPSKGKKLSRDERNAKGVDQFVKQGTPSTKKLTKKQRSNIIEVYKKKCSHAPRLNYSTDWEDVIRIAHDVAPSSMCSDSEIRTAAANHKSLEK